MNPDLEEVGTLVSAGLAAHEVDAVSIAARHDTETHANCLNCGAALGGAYYPRCGQAAHLHRSLLHLSEEFMHGVLHFDAKGFHTVPLLFFRPGLLTRRYMARAAAKAVRLEERVFEFFMTISVGES
jgi:hypothetical protein